VVADSLVRRNQEPLRAKYPYLSGYSAFGSNPIIFSDPDGNDKWAAMFLVKQIDANLKLMSEKTKSTGHEYGALVKYSNEGNKYSTLPIVTSESASSVYTSEIYEHNDIKVNNNSPVARALTHPGSTGFSYMDIFTFTNNPENTYKKENDTPFKFSIVETEDIRYVLEINDREKAYNIAQELEDTGIHKIMNNAQNNELKAGKSKVEAREIGILEVVKIFEWSVSFYKSVKDNKNKLEEMKK